MASKIERLHFSRDAVAEWTSRNMMACKWPVVYILTSKTDIYVGETLSFASRMRQHLDAPAKRQLDTIHLILNPTFNKSVSLDLEAYLIQMSAGSNDYRVLNCNAGIAESDYYERQKYRAQFPYIFNELKQRGIFTQRIVDIENSNLFKLSPFKALTEDQEVAMKALVCNFLDNLKSGRKTSTVIQGDPGTGKTVVVVYLIKLLTDIGSVSTLETPDRDTAFSEFFTEENRTLLGSLRLGLVIPQQSLRASVRKVFYKTLGLQSSMVLSAFDVGEDTKGFDLLLIDETHRLSQRAAQASGSQNKQFKEINETLFGYDDTHKTQLDWLRVKSKHQIFLLDIAQTIRPADLPHATLSSLATTSTQLLRLHTQMRVSAGSDFVSYVRGFLNTDRNSPAQKRQHFDDYDFRLFENLSEMCDTILHRERQVGLARLVAGYAWEWRSRRFKNAVDIEIDGTSLCWNSKQTDWIASSGESGEVGSIHTVQGYDLNYAGVIIGPDLRFCPEHQHLYIERDSYLDKRGKYNNKTLGVEYSDIDLLRFITQIYAVLMTRGIRGTYVYACDPDLREYLKAFIPADIPTIDA